MGITQDFWQQIKAVSDPKEQLHWVEGNTSADPADLQAAKAWWEARYFFTNKKKTQVTDRFIWFLINLWGITTSTPSTSRKQVVNAYREAFLSPKIEEAISLHNRLEEEVHDACLAYIQTLDPNPGFLGLKMGKTMNQSEILNRVAAMVAGRLMVGVYTQCADLKYANLIVRGLWKGAVQVYPDISNALEFVVNDYRDAAMRDFVLKAIKQ